MNKMINDREKAARRLAGMFRRYGSMIADRLQPRLAEVLEEGEEVPDVALLLDLLGRMVLAELADLDEADYVRGRDGGEAQWAQRQLHDKALPELRDRVVEVRRQIVHFCGRAHTSRFLGVRDRTPRAAEEVQDLAGFMVRNLPVLKVPKVAGQQMDPASWVEFLAPALDEVRGLRETLFHHGEDEIDSVALKEKAMDSFDQTYRLIVKAGESFFQLTGFDRLAEHLRYKASGRPAEQKKASNTVA